MRNMNGYKRGDVVLVRYQFTAGEEPRLRPALVVSTETYHQGRQQTVLSAITSNPSKPQPGDTVIQGWKEAGLLGPSMVTGVLLTVAPDSVDKRLGPLVPRDMQGVENSLKLSLGL